MLETLRRNQPSQVDFKLSGQGKTLNFVRQGAPGHLSVLVIGKEAFSIVVWVLIIAAGVLMLKLSGFHRVMVILAAAFVAGIMHLFLPLLVNQVVQVGVYAGILVLLLWVSRWGFVTFPSLRQQLSARREASLEKKRKTKTQQQSQTGTAQEPQPPDEKQQKQSKQDEE
jgi:membrane protein implicated in regulation of membrane protease activity